MAFIDVISYEEAEGRLKEIYDDVIKRRGKLGELLKVQSLNPESLLNHTDLYVTVMYSRSPLLRYQRELIAIVVSVANKCGYCVEHHSIALNHFWKDQKKVEQLAEDFTKAGLSEADTALAKYAYDLTVNPTTIKKEEHIDRMKNLGLDDRSILDAALIISYFNFANRMILGLGVELEEEAGGYNYE